METGTIYSLTITGSKNNFSKIKNKKQLETNENGNKMYQYLWVTVLRRNL